MSLKTALKRIFKTNPPPKNRAGGTFDKKLKNPLVTKTKKLT